MNKVHWLVIAALSCCVMEAGCKWWKNNGTGGELIPHNIEADGDERRIKIVPVLPDEPVELPVAPKAVDPKPKAPDPGGIPDAPDFSTLHDFRESTLDDLINRRYSLVNNL